MKDPRMHSVQRLTILSLLAPFLATPLFIALVGWTRGCGSQEGFAGTWCGLGILIIAVGLGLITGMLLAMAALTRGRHRWLGWFSLMLNALPLTLILGWAGSGRVSDLWRSDLKGGARGFIERDIPGGQGLLLVP